MKSPGSIWEPGQQEHQTVLQGPSDHTLHPKLCAITMPDKNRGGTGNCDPSDGETRPVCLLGHPDTNHKNKNEWQRSPILVVQFTSDTRESERGVDALVW